MGMQIEIGEDGYLTPESARFLQMREKLDRFCQLHECRYRPEDLVAPSAERGPYQTTQHNSGALPPESQPAEVKELSEPEGEDDDAEDEEVADNYDDAEAWSFSDLKAEAKRRELPVTGGREVLIERLRADDAAGADEE
jgi:hypothetical protein